MQGKKNEYIIIDNINESRDILKSRVLAILVLTFSILMIFSGCGKDKTTVGESNTESSSETASDGSTSDSSAVVGESAETAPPEPQSFVTLKTFESGNIYETVPTPEDYVVHSFVCQNIYADLAKPSISAPAEYNERKIGSDDFYKGFCLYKDVETLKIEAALYITFTPDDFFQIGYTDEYLNEHFPEYETRINSIVTSVTEKGFEKTAEQTGTAFGFNAHTYVFETANQVQLMLLLDNTSRGEDALAFRYSVYGDKNDPDSIEAMINMFYSLSLTV